MARRTDFTAPRSSEARHPQHERQRSTVLGRGGGGEPTGWHRPGPQATAPGRRTRPQRAGKMRNRVRPNPTRSIIAAKRTRPARLRQQERVARTRLLRTAPRRPGVAPLGAAARRSGYAPPRRGRHRRPPRHGFLAAVQQSWHAPA
jgi:hypothetical protein